MQNFNFTKGFIAGFIGIASLLLILQLTLTIAGELSLDYVVTRQFNHPKILFSSGINQNAYSYKFALLNKTKPKVLAIGSSRAMQVRKEFINSNFVNFGGTVSNVSDLEAVAKDIGNSPNKPELLLLFIDPWWFNAKFPGAMETHADIKFPSVINMGVIINSADAFSRGNWLKELTASPHLGIHSILTNEGFSNDGSYHYANRISGKTKFSDVNFSNTIDRINGEKQRFEKSEVADSLLLERACNAIIQMSTATQHLVIIAPPFAGPVWDKMQQGGYEYINQVHTSLSVCNKAIQLFDYSNPTTISASQCEFVDGFHGGDTVSARMLEDISLHDSIVSDHINLKYIKKFLNKFAGYAAGVTVMNYPQIKEIDFLGKGCNK